MPGATTRQLLVAEGSDDDGGDRLHRRGSWQRIAVSTYLPHPLPATDLELASAAHLRTAGRGVITGAVACRALGLRDVPSTDFVQVLVPAARRLVSSQHVRVLPTVRAPETWRGPAGLRYASLERAVTDAARGACSLRDVRALVLSAVTSRLTTSEALREELDAGTRGGSAWSRRALDDADRGAWSAPEAEFVDMLLPLVRRGSLPPLVLNAELRLHGRLLGVADGYLLGTGLGYEVDSRRHHAGVDDFDRTLARHDGFAAGGVTLLHVTPRRLRRLGPAYRQVVVDAVRSRQALGHREHPDLKVVPRFPVLGRLRR